MIRSGEELVHGAGTRAHCVEQAGPFRHDHRRDPAADAMVEIGHVHGVRFVLGLDTLDLRLVGQGIEKGPHGAAGIPEIVLKSGDLEPLGDRINHAHLCAPGRGVACFLTGPSRCGNVCNKIRCSQRRRSKCRFRKGHGSRRRTQVVRTSGRETCIGFWLRSRSSGRSPVPPSRQRLRSTWRRHRRRHPHKFGRADPCASSCRGRPEEAPT